MDFKHKLLKYIAEANAPATPKTGLSVRKETKMSSAGSSKARDAARKRAERQNAPKKEQLPSAELIKQIIAVKTTDGKTELIYKDSFNNSYHEVLNPEKDLSIEDAKGFTKDPAFIQTQASQQLFGDLTKKAESKERKRATTETSGKAEGEEGVEDLGPEVENKKFIKPKKMGMQDLLASMSTMNGTQLGSIPFDLRQEFFMQNRDPMAAKDFDALTYDSVATKFGISEVDIPYNEQVKNALIMVARLKAGASDSELTFVTNLKNGSFTQFGREAFEQAKKILSKVGDECIQMMVSASEAGLAGISAEGKTDFKCGNVKFAVNSQGEISLSSGDMTQLGKGIKKTIQRSIIQTMQDPSLAGKDPIYNTAINQVNDIMASSGTGLMSDESFAQATKDPSVLAFMQSEPVISPTGENLGPMASPTGEINPAISFKQFEDNMTRTVDKFIAQEKSKKAPFMQSLIRNTIANHLRGDGAVDPESAPSHLVTNNGIFPMSDDYFADIAASSDITIEKTNKSYYNKASRIDKYSVVVEAVANVDPYQQIRDMVSSMLVPTGNSPIEVLSNTLNKNYNFDMNVSLLPGIKPNEIHGVEYNLLSVQGKRYKIPVLRDQELVAASFEESYVAANSILLESLTNDDVIRALYETNLITYDDAECIVYSRYNDMTVAQPVLIPILQRLAENIHRDPSLIEICKTNLIEAKERDRDYKREYKLFHSKPSQIKNRTARTTARRRAIKKGKVRIGDNKDIDHKKPLRNGGSNKESNLRVRDRSANRSDNGKYKGQAPDKPRTDK